MDIEGHELFALRGMEKMIANSPNVKILFEKIGKNRKWDAELEDFFDKQNMSLFGVRSKIYPDPTAAGRTDNVEW